MFYFQKMGSEFQFWHSDTCLYHTDRVAFVVDRAQGCFLKHGPVDRIKHYFDTLQNTYRAAGVGDLADDIEMVEAADWPLEELNKILDITGYIGRYLDQIEAGVQV